MKECPYCHAAIPEDASFCLYCMRELAPRTKAEPVVPARRSLRVLPVVLIALILTFAALLVILIIKINKKEARFSLPAFTEFQANASAAVSERYPDLWDPYAVTPAERANMAGTEVVTSSRVLWASSEAGGLSQPFRLAYANEDGQAALCFENLKKSEYETALGVAETFLDAAFGAYLDGFSETLRLDNDLWREENRDGQRVIVRYFRPDTGAESTVLILRTPEDQNGDFDFGVFLYPETH